MTRAATTGRAPPSFRGDDLVMAAFVLVLSNVGAAARGARIIAGARRSRQRTTGCRKTVNMTRDTAASVSEMP